MYMNVGQSKKRVRLKNELLCHAREFNITIMRKYKAAP